jgi:carboxyl-terminal processing protease
VRLAQATSAAETPYSVAAQLARVLVYIENDYVEPVERTRLLNGAVKGMVAELDPHSSYLPPREWALFTSETEGKFGGLGLEVDGASDVLTVLAPIEGGPAFKAGIRSGDRILAVDGEDAQGIGLARMVEHMRGDPGTHVKLTVQRPRTRTDAAAATDAGAHDDESGLKTYDLTREIVHVPSVDERRLAGDLAYVRIKQFQQGTHDELVAAAERVRAESAGATGTNAPIRGVVLDLRNNPGGLVDEASGVVDEFLDGGVIYTMRHRGQVVEEEHAHAGGVFHDVPIVLMVSEYSASASELVAGALQDSRRALVVGEPSFGKGSVQSLIELPGGAGLRLTTARYYTPSGHAIQADGIHPDLFVASPVATNALPVQRERDLEGHLTGETSPRTASPPSLDAGTSGATSREHARDRDGGSDKPVRPPHATVEGGFAETVPVDPSTGDDAQLREAYLLLRDRLAGRGPIVK